MVDLNAPPLRVGVFSIWRRHCDWLLWIAGRSQDSNDSYCDIWFSFVGFPLTSPSGLSMCVRCWFVHQSLVCLELHTGKHFLEPAYTRMTLCIEQTVAVWKLKMVDKDRVKHAEVWRFAKTPIFASST